MYSNLLLLAANDPSSIKNWFTFQKKILLQIQVLFQALIPWKWNFLSLFSICPAIRFSYQMCVKMPHMRFVHFLDEWTTLWNDNFVCSNCCYDSLKPSLIIILIRVWLSPSHFAKNCNLSTHHHYINYYHGRHNRVILKRPAFHAI